MMRARVLKSDGGEVQARVSADQPVVERGTSMYFDSRSRDLRFPAVWQPGDLVEIEYRLLPAGGGQSLGGILRADQTCSATLLRPACGGAC